MSENDSLESSLAQAVEDLNQAAIPYMLIGGLALTVWALPRATLDVDLTLWVEPDDFDRVCLHIASHYDARTSEPLAFARKMRVLPVANASGVRLDFLFAAYPFEKVMIDRAVVRRYGKGDVRVATLEDLILLKLPSARSKDREDVRSILQIYGRQLDWKYLLSVADGLAETLEQPDLASFLRDYRMRKMV